MRTKKRRNNIYKVDNSTYRVRKMIDGRLYTGTFTNREDAKRFVLELQNKHTFDSAGLESSPITPSLTLYNVLDKYLFFLKEHKRPQKTIGDFKSSVRNLKCYFDTDFKAGMITTQMVREYWAWRLNNKRGTRQTKGRAIQKDLTYLRIALNHCEVESTWRVDKTLTKKIPKPERHVLYPEEVLKLLEAMPEGSPERAYCEFLARMGCRPIEARLLKWNDVDLSEGFVTIRQSKTGKIQKRHLPLKLIKSIQRWKDSKENISDSENHVFTFNGKPLTEYSFRRRIMAASKSADITPPLRSVGTFRHSYVFALHKKKGMSKDQLQIIIGHESVLTTERYLRQLPSAQDDVAAKSIDEVY